MNHLFKVCQRWCGRRLGMIWTPPLFLMKARKKGLIEGCRVILIETIFLPLVKSLIIFLVVLWIVLLPIVTLVLSLFLRSSLPQLTLISLGLVGVRGKQIGKCYWPIRITRTKPPVVLGTWLKAHISSVTTIEKSVQHFKRWFPPQVTQLLSNWWIWFPFLYCTLILSIIAYNQANSISSLALYLTLVFSLGLKSNFYFPQLNYVRMSRLDFSYNLKIHNVICCWWFT